MTSVVGIVGAGVMGAGVAQVAAERGMRVILVDSDEAALGRARTRVRRGVRAGMLLGGERRDPVVVLDHIEMGTALEALAPADVIVENVTEDEALKLALHARLGSVAAGHAIVCANTSGVPIARLAAAFASRAGSAERVLGVHFMNPVPKKSVVEVVRAPTTSDATMARATAFLGEIGKTAIVVSDAPGFVSNRVLMLAINEAARVYEEGTASAEDIDRVFRECMGHAMGPLETADLIGLDTIVGSLEVLRAHVDSVRFAPAAVLLRLVLNGRLGRKSGRGFHEYGAPE